jgi:hypothetical protein
MFSIHERLIDPMSNLREKRQTPSGILNLTTMTGEQKESIAGIIKETRPAHRVRAPGLPSEGSQKPPLMKVEPSKTKGARGMVHIRGSKY